VVIREHKLLLGATALLSLGSVVATAATGGTSLWATFASSLLTSMTATNWGDLAKRLRDRPNLLTNEDLAKAAGSAIALGIREVALEYKYRDLASILNDLADRTPTYWLQIERNTEPPGEYAAIRENQVRYAFTA
jgi:hypothetical protein